MLANGYQAGESTARSRPPLYTRRCTAILAGALLVLTNAGCPQLSPTAPLPADDGAANGQGNDLGRRTTGEPNDTFSQAITVVYDGGGNGQITGSIATTDDVDVYRLGPFTAGDRIIVDISTGNSGLDADVALFDGDGRLVYENDDRNIVLNQLDPFINHVIRHDSDMYYLAIASSPLNPTIGAYDIVLTITRGGTVPPAAGQIIALDTDGGSATIGGETETVGPFDTGDISPAYEGMTAEVLDQIVATVLENYDGLALQVLVTSRDPVPGGCTVSTVLLGGTSNSAYGLADQIDPYNQDPCDAAIVYTEMFKPFRFGRSLTAAELGTAIGNVVAHEVGHLLGLNHVSNIHDLMDTTGSAGTFLLDQEFITSMLHDSIF
ncbi:MAG: matrixin family metalloprotease, partial [Planctomycetes bacterium]|nr:matrixin family metalloprotease [Planctomycetota bacterium]